MENWVLMLFRNLPIPFCMIGFGYMFIKSPPPEINGVFGYRTRRSMKNEATWAFAHAHCGKVWLITGAVLLVISLIAMLLLHKTAVENDGLWLCMVQLVILLASALPTEMALKKNFDGQNRDNR